MPKVGDTVRFLNSVGGGRIVRIEGNIAHVEDADGFDIPALLKECVVVMEGGAFGEKQAAKNGKAVAAKSDRPSREPAPSETSRYDTPMTSTPPSKYVAAPKEEPKPAPVFETPDGNRLNLTLAFDATDIKQLSRSDFEAVLVNDSNYFLNLTFATRSDDSTQWTLRRAAVLEPNMVLTLCTIANQEVNKVDCMLLECVAYKEGKSYDRKAPVSFMRKIDSTKFFKLHCYRPNCYFDSNVIAYDVISNDIPVAEPSIDHRQLEEAMRQKRAAEQQQKRPVQRRQPKESDILEVDLHIDQLLDNTHGLSRSDMLNHQIDEFRKVMDANLRNHGRKIVFIHGKGEGILRQALLKELNHRYKGHDVSDASFREYGFGATQVTIK